MATVEEELRGTRIKECLPSIAYAQQELDRHIREMELRKQNEKLIISPDTLTKIKETPMARQYQTAAVLTDKDLLVLLKHCRFNSRYLAEKLNIDSQTYPAIGILAFFRNCIKLNSTTGFSTVLGKSIAERARDFYNTHKGQILTPKAGDALGAFQGKHCRHQGVNNRPSAPVTIVLPKQTQTYTKLVAIRELSHNVAVFDVAGKSEDFIEGIKTGLSRVFEDTKFILGEES